MFREQQVEIDRGTTGYREQKQATFPVWADEYERILEEREVKGSTRRTYAQTLELARESLYAGEDDDEGDADEDEINNGKED